MSIEIYVGSSPILIYIFYVIYKHIRNKLKSKDKFDSSFDNIENDIPSKFDSIIKNVEEKSIEKRIFSQNKVNDNVSNISENNEKRDFNPYKHKLKIDIAEQNIQRIRKIYFEERKSPGYVMNKLKEIEGLVFEEMVLTCFKEAGFRIWRSPKHTGDGGFDGMIFINDTKILLQSKCWTKHINNIDVEEFSNLIVKKGAQFGYFIHTGRTGPKSYSNLKNNAHFISGAKVLHLILQPSENDFNGSTFLIPQIKKLLLNKN